MESEPGAGARAMGAKMHSEGGQQMGMGHSVAREETSDLEDFGFSHLVLEVADLDRSEAFYREVVGLDVLGRGLMAEPGPHSLLRMNTGQLLVLVQVEKPIP